MVTLKVCSTMAAEAIEETTKRRRAQTRETLTPSISRDRKMRWSELQRTRNVLWRFWSKDEIKLGQFIERKW